MNKLVVFKSTFLASFVVASTSISSPVFAQQTPSNYSLPILPLTSTVKTVYVQEPTNQSTSSNSNKFLLSLPIQIQVLIRDFRKANLNQTTGKFMNSSEGSKLSTYLNNNPNVATEMFKNSDANNPVYLTSEILAPIQTGNKVKYIFPDGSSITESSTLTPISSTGNANSSLATPDNYYPIGGNNYANNWTWSTSDGYGEITNTLYTDFNYVKNSSGYLVFTIWNKYGTASSAGLAVSATYDGDAQITVNDSPYSSDMATYSDSLGVGPIGYSFTRVLSTSFNGAGGVVSISNIAANQ